MMMNEPLIDSLLDTDLYKLTMMQAILHHYPGARTVWRFRCRAAGVDLRPLADPLREQIRHLGTLRASAEEIAGLRSLDYLKEDFLDFLRILSLNPEAVEVHEGAEQLEITVRGSWLHVSGWEIYLLAMVSELYGRTVAPEATAALDEGRRRLAEKVRSLRSALAVEPEKPFRLFEFGTRRRFSRAWQREVLTSLQAEFPEQLWGTSNVKLAQTSGLRPIGTFAHEWVQAHQALGPRLVDSQKAALDTWAREYRGRLGIALSDCITLDAFLGDFDLFFAKLFDGVRQDSGDPMVAARKVIAHYERLKIDPRTKAIVFSDSLNFDKALALWRALEPKIQTSFGIGTFLTNDVGVPPLNAVLKMISCNGQPVAKISDAPGKGLCEDPEYLLYLAQVFGVKSDHVGTGES